MRRLGWLSWVQIFLLVGKVISLGNMGDWSWWLILAPIWVSVLAAVLYFIVMFPVEIVRQRQNRPWYEKL